MHIEPECLSSILFQTNTVKRIILIFYPLIHHHHHPSILLVDRTESRTVASAFTLQARPRPDKYPPHAQLPRVTHTTLPPSLQHHLNHNLNHNQHNHLSTTSRPVCINCSHIPKFTFHNSGIYPRFFPTAERDYSEYTPALANLRLCHKRSSVSWPLRRHHTTQLYVLHNNTKKSQQ